MNFLKTIYYAIASIFSKAAAASDTGSAPPGAPPAALPPASVRRIAIVEEVRGGLAKECYEHAYAAARTSKRRTSDPAMLKAL